LTKSAEQIFYGRREFVKVLGRSSFVGSRQLTLSSQLSEHPLSCDPQFEKAEMRVQHLWFHEKALPLARQESERRFLARRLAGLK
jgi:hypothetical protein